MNTYRGILDDHQYSIVRKAVVARGLRGQNIDDAMQNAVIDIVKSGSRDDAMLSRIASSSADNLSRDQNRFDDRNESASAMRNEHYTIDQSAIDERLDREAELAPLFANPVICDPRKLLTAELLADFRKCPALYRRKIDNYSAPNGESVLDLAAHSLLLEGMEAFDSRFVVGYPVDPLTGDVMYDIDEKAREEWAAEMGRRPLTEEQFSIVKLMAESVTSHKVASELLRDGSANIIAGADYRDAQCQITADWFSPRSFVGIVDLVIVDDLDEASLEFEAKKNHFAYRLSFLRSVMAVKLKKIFPVHLIAVERNSPYRCGVWEVHRDVLDDCELDNEDCIRRLLRCRESGVWPTGYEAPRVLAAA